MGKGGIHCCEMAGPHDIVTPMHSIDKPHNVSARAIAVACSNKHALQVFEEACLPDTFHVNHDLVAATWQMIQTSPIDWHGEHVKGHQDNKKLARLFTRTEKLNIEMDQLAKDPWQHFAFEDFDAPLPRAPHRSILGEGWQLWE